MEDSKRIEVEYFLPSTGERGHYYRRVPEVTPQVPTVAEEVPVSGAAA